MPRASSVESASCCRTRSRWPSNTQGEALMRIARYIAAGRETVGVVDADRVVDIADLSVGVAADVVAILEQGPEVWRSLQRDATGHRGTPLSDVELLAPVAKPPKFLAVGMNSEDHVREAKTAPRTPDVLEIIRAMEHMHAAFPKPRFPGMFNKQTTSIAGPR